MKRRSLRSLALATLLAMSANPIPASAAVAASCDAGVQKVMHSYILRQSGSYDAIAGDAVTRQLVPCTSPNAVKGSAPLVLAANLEGGDGQIVQVGYVRCGTPAGQACGIDGSVPNDGKIHFVYTQNDNCGGCYKLADGWSNGAPTIGHRYRYKITSEAGRWNFCIRDLTTGNVYFCKPNGISQDFSQGTLAWWGTEVQNTNAAMGPCWCGGANDIDMYWMQYSNPANPGWIVVTDAFVNHTNLPHPARYHDFTYDVNYVDDGMKSHTDDS